ncbi:MAG TPA: ABC transporter permease [Pusillimonas sp.]|uniref:ABC transporter permease n=1 Tax=Pusillimonas sp. TaxID=3040095 RepID=UPI002CFBBA11|nr:ABC transporter permease [Pusillimonas sp.]HUH88219.1 ABC transporter permease [Pusillimonas sp.]
MKAALNNMGMGTAGSLSLIVVFIIWEILCRLLNVRDIMLPLPSQIFVELWNDLPWYLSHSAYTLWTTVAGFVLSVIGGVLIAVCLVSSRIFERFVYPLIIGFNSVPKVALAPLFVVWLGTGAEPKIAIAFLIAVFAIIVDTVHGLRSVPTDITDLGKVLRGSAWDFFFKVKLPCALPSIVAGMKVAMSLALVGAIVGEFVSSQRGLGYIIMSAQGTFDTVRVFAALFILAVMGLALYGLLAWFERKATPWRLIHSD